MIQDAPTVPKAASLDAASLAALAHTAEAMGLSFRGFEDGYLAFDVSSGAPIDRAGAKALAASVVAELRRCDEPGMQALLAAVDGVRIEAAAHDRPAPERVPA